MAFSSGTYSLYTPGNPVVTNTTMTISWGNNTLNDIATALSLCVLKDGTQTITANMPMAGYKLTGLGAGSAAGDSVRYEQVLGANGIKGTAATSLTAAGTGQSDALQLAATANKVTTAAASTGVKLYASPVAGDIQAVYNGGANPLTVYPGTGGAINGLATNTGHILPTNTTALYFAVSTTAWIGILSA